VALAVCEPSQRELNRRGIQTPRGKGEWQASTVSQLLARLPA